MRVVEADAGGLAFILALQATHPVLADPAEGAAKHARPHGLLRDVAQIRSSIVTSSAMAMRFIALIDPGFFPFSISDR